MRNIELLSRISVDPTVCFGKPCIREQRTWVSVRLDSLTSGLSVDEVLDEYPQLVRDDILACIAFAVVR